MLVECVVETLHGNFIIEMHVIVVLRRIYFPNISKERKGLHKKNVVRENESDIILCKSSERIHSLPLLLR